MKGVRQLFERMRDGIITYDPAQNNLRLACRVLLSVLLALLAIILLGRLTGHPAMSLSVAVILAMNTSSAARDPLPRARRVTMALTALPAALAVTLAALLNLVPLGAEVGFVLVACAGVYIRRFGPRGFAFGMAGFMSYFFALFTRVQLDALPWVYGALLVGSLCSLLSYLLIPDLSLARTLSASLDALRGRLRQYVAACLGDVRRDSAGARREQRRAETRLSEATLAVGESVAAFSESSGAAELTAHLLDLELSARRLGRASSDLQAQEKNAALRDLGRLLHWTLAGRGGKPWQPGEDAPAPLRHALGAFTRALTDLRGFDLTRLEPRSDAAPPGPKPALASGMRLTTRQALQAALACVLAMLGGELISPARWYWAVITAFIVFTGTSTRGEVFVRGWLRVLGTLGGVVVGVLLATLLHGNLPLSLALILLSVFLGFYLIRLSYALMIFHITVTLALFYGLTGTFSPGLLELRLAETAYGAVAGMLAAGLLMPTQTRAQLRLETQAFFGVLAGLFEDLAAGVREGKPVGPLGFGAVSARSLSLARQHQRLRAAALPLTRYPLRGSWQRSVSHRLQLIWALEYEVDGLLQTVRTIPELPEGENSEADLLACSLADLQRRCEALAAGRPPRERGDGGAFTGLDGGPYEVLGEHLERVGDRLRNLEPGNPEPVRERSGARSPAR